MRQVKSCQNEFQPKANSCRDWQVTAVKELAERKRYHKSNKQKATGTNNIRRRREMFYRKHLDCQVCWSSKVKPQTSIHPPTPTPPPPKQKPLNVQKFTSQSLVYLHSTCYLFHTYSIQPGGHVKNVPDVCKKSTTSFAQYYVRVNQFRSRRQ